MTLTQLRHLAAIVDSGLNVTAAAAQLHATQSGVSKQLKALEDELGFQLFVRRGKRLERLTVAGSEVLVHARAVLREAANIGAVAANHRGEAGDALRIATTHTQARHVLPEPLAALRSRFPGVQLHLSPGDEKEALDQLSLGRVDLAVVSGLERPPGSAFAVPLYRWNLVGVAPHGHPLAGGGFGLADLAAHPLVTYRSALEPTSSFARAFAEAGLTPQLACVAADSGLIKTFVRAGMGIGLIAEMAVDDEDDLDTFPLDGLFRPRTAWAALTRDRVVRDDLLELLLALAPRFGRADLRRLREGDVPSAKAVPDWREARAWLGGAVRSPPAAPFFSHHAFADTSSRPPVSGSPLGQGATR